MEQFLKKDEPTEYLIDMVEKNFEIKIRKTARALLDRLVQDIEIRSIVKKSLSHSLSHEKESIIESDKKDAIFVIKSFLNEYYGIDKFEP